MQTSQAQRLGQLGPVVAFATLDLNHLGQELLIAAVEVGANRLLLGLKPKAGAPLPGGADADVQDELALSHLTISCL
jgi:hypothetical protein